MRSEGVYAVQGDALDVAYLRTWADALRVRPEWEALVSGTIKPKST